MRGQSPEGRSDVRGLEGTGFDGFLAAVYRHVGDHVKVGVVYNFTDFSDDLNHLDEEMDGWFVKLIGKYQGRLRPVV